MLFVVLFRFVNTWFFTQFYFFRPSFPSYISKSSAGSANGSVVGMDNETQWSVGFSPEDNLVSPNTISVDLIDDNSQSNDKTSAFVQQQQEEQRSLDELAAFEGDPLEWLIEIGVNEVVGKNDGASAWLSESTMTFFPDLNKDKLMTYHHHRSEESPALDVSAEHALTKNMVEAAISNNMVDPIVTVQSLFMPDDTTMHLA